MQFDREAALQASFDELTKIVRERFREGRSTVAAALKAELQTRFGGRFNQAAIGYDSFRDLLKDAEARQLIRLRTASGGDLEALPPEVPAQQAAPSTAIAEAGTYIRPDVWRAFVDWRQNWTRVYDLERDRAVMFPATPSPFDATEWIEMRQSSTEHPDRYKAIEPIAMDVQLRWMREFVDAIPEDAAREQLRAALDTQKPFGTFARAAQSLPDVKTRWNRAREERVLALVRAWMQRNGLTLSVVQERRPRAAETTQPTPSAGASEQQLRTALHAAIDRMPLAELKRIELPVGYFVD